MLAVTSSISTLPATDSDWSPPCPRLSLDSITRNGTVCTEKKTDSERKTIACVVPPPPATTNTGWTPTFGIFVGNSQWSFETPKYYSGQP